MIVVSKSGDAESLGVARRKGDEPTPLCAILPRPSYSLRIRKHLIEIAVFCHFGLAPSAVCIQEVIGCVYEFGVACPAVLNPNISIILDIPVRNI